MKSFDSPQVMLIHTDIGNLSYRGVQFTVHGLLFTVN